MRRRDLWFKAFNAEPRIFLTLTMRPDSELSPDQQAEKFVVAWRMLRQFLCRRLERKSITFLAVFEAHESGWPHLHILLRGGYIDHRVIRKWWEGYTGSFQIDIRLAKNPRQRASYVSKYVAKNPGRFEHVKRYWCSQDWDLKKKQEQPSSHAEYAWWEAVSVTPIGLARAALGSGARVTWRDNTLIIEGWEATSRALWGLG